MKQWAAIAVGIVLIADIAIFAGWGFGTGALAVASAVTNTTTNQYQPGSDCSPANAISNPGGTYLATCVNASMPNIANTGETPTSTILPDGLSTDISFVGSVQQFIESGHVRRGRARRRGLEGARRPFPDELHARGEVDGRAQT